VPLMQRSVLDRWILARLNALVVTVTQALESYDVTGATRPIADFVEELSNWYVRLAAALLECGAGCREPAPQPGRHQTLYEVLVSVSHLLAPFTPFIADEMYRNLIAETVTAAPVSVHLSHWPAAVSAHADEG